MRCKVDLTKRQEVKVLLLAVIFIYKTLSCICFLEVRPQDIDTSLISKQKAKLEYFHSLPLRDSESDLCYIPKALDSVL